MRVATTVKNATIWTAAARRVRERCPSFTKFFIWMVASNQWFMEGIEAPMPCAQHSLSAEDKSNCPKVPPSSGLLLEAVLYRGNLPRSGYSVGR